jgi:hypothetical protein
MTTVIKVHMCRVSCILPNKGNVLKFALLGGTAGSSNLQKGFLA